MTCRFDSASLPGGGDSDIKGTGGAHGTLLGLKTGFGTPRGFSINRSIAGAFAVPFTFMWRQRG